MNEGINDRRHGPASKEGTTQHVSMGKGVFLHVYVQALRCADMCLCEEPNPRGLVMQEYSHSSSPSSPVIELSWGD